jgi:hypothetical protein
MGGRHDPRVPDSVKETIRNLAEDPTVPSRDVAVIFADQTDDVYDMLPLRDELRRRASAVVGSRVSKEHVMRLKTGELVPLRDIFKDRGEGGPTKIINNQDCLDFLTHTLTTYASQEMQDRYRYKMKEKIRAAQPVSTAGGAQPGFRLVPVSTKMCIEELLTVLEPAPAA